MDWEPTQTVSAASVKTTQQGKPKAKWVSQQELDRRKEANECLRCGSKDHFIRQCSLGPARRPEATMTTAAAKKPKVRIATTKTKSKRSAQKAAVVSEESTDDEESGSDYGSENE